jgi:hypothetical protein
MPRTTPTMRRAFMRGGAASITPGRPVDRGLVLQLVGALNDEKLVRLGYFAPLDAKSRNVPLRTLRG